MSRAQRSNRKSEAAEESSGFESTTVGVYRTAATIKGGRRFSFGSLVVAGDRSGSVGIGYAKATEVPPAIEKAEKEARRNLKRVQLQGGTIPHTVMGRFGASSVRLIPASPGTGVVAGATVRAVLELAGVRDCLTKCYGSTNAKNLVKATLNGLQALRSKEQVAALRGVTIEASHVDHILERGAVFTTGAASRRPGVALELPKAPKATAVEADPQTATDVQPGETGPQDADQMSKDTQAG